jgi:Na+/H+ antiporter NhaC
MEYQILSIIIPLLTIIIAIVTKDVVISLLGGIFAGELVLHHYNFFDAFLALFDGIVALFAKGWITKTIIFMLLVGAIIKIITNSGAIDRFVAYLSQKAKRIDSPKGAMMLAYIIGVVIFIESSITSLVAGTVARPLCDKHGVSRAKLAYICDSTSAPICSLIPLNAWGALLLGLITTAIDSHIISGDAISLLVHSIIYNFYSIFTLIIVLAVIYLKFELPPMKNSKAIAYTPIKEIDKNLQSPWSMILPVALMVVSVPVGLYLSGGGEIFKGSGSTSVYYAVIVTLIFLYFYYVPKKMISHKEYFNSLYEGMSDMIPVSIILILALFIGNIISDLGTAKYISSLLDGNISTEFVPMIIFLTASVMAFATGTSWGTFSIMMPIGLALAGTMHLDIPLVIAAVISGGIFGDHSSPISDTTIISSMASGCDHIEHVRTQLPYALIGGVLASIAFWLVAK